jgi:dTDP-4-amino-4,6-dideoxygalactose transaminase
MKSHGTIPFLDLITPHRELEEELVAVFRDCIRNAHFIGGNMLEEFERDFAKFCDAKYAIGVANGTDAVRFALMAAGVAPGDVVVTVPNTFIATTEAISQSGALPEFVDVDENSSTLDPEKLRTYLEEQCQWEDATGRLVSRRSRREVRAIVPVHLYGQMADMDPILELAERYHLVVVEDACQAHGAEYFSAKEDRWRKAGSMGCAAAFSFYPGKNLGACGEAGAVTTNDPELARVISMLRDHGQSRKYHHEIEGYNGRLDALQAGLLHVKLRHLAEWNQQRRDAAQCYHELFQEAPEGITVPLELPWAKSVYHLYVIRCQDRTALMEDLAKAGIATGIHYPIPLHLQAAYSRLGYAKGDFPVTEKLAPEILSLPMFPTLTPEQQSRVYSAIVNSVSAMGVDRGEDRVPARPLRPAVR